MHCGFLGLWLDEELCIQADFLGVVMAHMEELGHMLLLAAHLGVPQVLVTFAAAPEYVVLSTQTLGDFQRMLQLATRICIDISEWRGGSAGDEARIGEQRRGVPQQLDASGLHILFDAVHNLIEVGIGLAQGLAFRSDIAIMEAEVLSAQLGEELEGIINLGQGFVHRVGILAQPRTVSGADTEWVDQLLIEGVPPSNAEAQPILHLLAGDNAVGVVIMEAQTFLWTVTAAHILNLVNIPQTHGCSFAGRAVVAGISDHRCLHSKLIYPYMSNGLTYSAFPLNSCGFITIGKFQSLKVPNAAMIPFAGTDIRRSSTLLFASKQHKIKLLAFVFP